MNNKEPVSKNFPVHLKSRSGLNIQLNSNGSVMRMDRGDILLNLFPGTEVEGGPANIYLRCYEGPSIESIPLLGPKSPSAFCFDRGLTALGDWNGFRYCLSLKLAESAPAWFWHVALENIGDKIQRLDLLYTQDLALAQYRAVRINEFYTSHYVDHTPLLHLEKGTVLASRQNLSMGGKNPWVIIGALGRGILYCTDALQFHGLETRAGRPPEALLQGLPGVRKQHEHSLAAIQQEAVELKPGGRAELGFFGWFEADHPDRSSPADLVIIDRVLALPEAVPPGDRKAGVCTRPAKSLFSAAPLLESLDLTEDETAGLFGERREEERKDGRLLSFFCGIRSHVVLRQKELKVLRPHAHILRTGSELTPDESALTSTAWMSGVFHSMITQGHVGINRFLSTVRGYLGLFRGNGMRIFVELEGILHLLDVPSAFEISPRYCRWIYKHHQGLIEVRSAAPVDRHELVISMDVLLGPPLRFLLSCHVALNGDDGGSAVPVQYTQEREGVFVQPVPDSDLGRGFPGGGFLITPLERTGIERLGRDEMLFEDSLSRNQPYLCLLTVPTLTAGFRITGRLVHEDQGKVHAPDGPLDASNDNAFWSGLTSGLRLHPPAGSSLSGAVARMGDVLPWFTHNALIHYLAPRGIEQYTGGGWGTRDICQGPVEMLLALGRFEPVRDLLIRVFKAQNPDGDWPQWFMFFDRERNIRAADSHGDIVFWPLLALAHYLIASGDKTLLGESIPFFHPEGDLSAETVPLWGHVERALSIIAARIIPGTGLAAYGNGDWNDSLQPVLPEMRDRLCSAWTATLQYQALTTLARALNLLGMADRAQGLEAAAGKVRQDFTRLLIADETVTGFAVFQEDGPNRRIDYLLHPRDGKTGLSYRLLPMIHAIIGDLLSPEQALRHLQVIRAHLLGPDGARLFDRPLEYRGGPQRYFRRAESAAFFGREIGLMYMHAHLRYAEALAHHGDTENFFQALCQANPIGIRTLVPAAALRQSNCYYSSSDAAFADRYEASSEYGRINSGDVPLEGGWRIYSSGAGIWTRLFLQCFLGIRRQRSLLAIDPVMSPSLDGLRIEIELEGAAYEITYRVSEPGFGPEEILLNGRSLPFFRGLNPYRIGGAKISWEVLKENLHEGRNKMTIVAGERIR